MALEVVVVFGVVGADAVPVGPLEVCINVHFDGAVADGFADFFA